MRDFVRQYRCQFIVIGCDLKQAAIYVNASTWKSQRVDFSRIDDPEVISQRRQGAVLTQPLADGEEVASDVQIAD